MLTSKPIIKKEWHRKNRRHKNCKSKKIKGEQEDNAIIIV